MAPLKILHLTLKKEWFDKIARGEKTEEYREIKDYWRKRLTTQTPYSGAPKYFDEIHFKNGYSKDSPFMRVKWNGLEYTVWDFKIVYAIQLGPVLEIRNWKG